MFGCCVAGRLLQTDLQQVDDTHAVFHLPSASSINHLSVFLLGTVPFPDGFGATVHLYWPGKGFQLLGMLSNEKPSAIFRLRGAFTSSADSNAHNAFSSASQTPEGALDITAVLGFSVEPLAQIQPQIATLSSAAPTSAQGTDSAVWMADRVAKHLYNYVSGFVDGGVRQDTQIPLNVIGRWYESFMGKVKAGGTGFLERIE